MTATPVPPLMPAASTTPDTATTRISNPKALIILRIVWLALLALEILYTAYILPISVNPENFRAQRPEEIALLEQYGIARAAYAANTALAGFAFMVSVSLAGMLMWRSRNELNAVFFSFVFLMTSTTFFSSVTSAIPRFVGRSQDLLLNAGILTLFYLFPDRSFIPRWLRYVFAISLLNILLSSLTSDDLSDTSSAIFFAALIIGGLSVIYRFRHAQPQQRQQLKWLALPLVSLPILFLLWFIDDVFIPAPAGVLIQIIFGFIGSTIFLLLPVAVGVAVLRYRLWDIDLVINRSLVYGAVTILLALIFGSIIALVSAITQGQGAVIGAAVAALAAGALFNPARKRIQHFVDRRIYHLNFDLNQLAAAQKLPNIQHPGALSGHKLGPYDILDVIGKGGMGEVYKGQTDGQIVAIKILPSDLAQQEEFRKRFEREGQALAALHHANVVKMIGSGSSDGIVYLAMEYIVGDDLSRKLKLEGSLTLDDTLNILKGLASALDYAHEQGFIHRDIKPSNVMLRGSKSGATWDAILMDFGVAKVHDAQTKLTNTGAIGTIEYMAPEQIMSAKAVDRRADIYALGVMAYEMLAGERPFKGGAAQVMFAHLQQPPPDPRDVKETIPSLAADAIMRALSKQADDRFSTAGEFVAALR